MHSLYGLNIDLRNMVFERAKIQNDIHEPSEAYEMKLHEPIVASETQVLSRGYTLLFP